MNNTNSGMTYDEQSLLLAQHFLGDCKIASPEERRRLEEQLARTIQRAVEDFLEDVAHE